MSERAASPSTHAPAAHSCVLIRRAGSANNTRASYRPRGDQSRAARDLAGPASPSPESGRRRRACARATQPPPFPHHRLLFPSRRAKVFQAHGSGDEREPIREVTLAGRVPSWLRRATGLPSLRRRDLSAPPQAAAKAAGVPAAARRGSRDWASPRSVAAPAAMSSVAALTRGSPDVASSTEAKAARARGGGPLALPVVARAPMPGPHLRCCKRPRRPAGEPGASAANGVAGHGPASNSRGVSAASPRVPRWALVGAALAMLVFPGMGGLASPLRLAGHGRTKSLSQLAAGLRQAGAPVTAVQPSYRIGNRSVVLGECYDGATEPGGRRGQAWASLAIGRPCGHGRTLARRPNALAWEPPAQCQQQSPPTSLAFDRVRVCCLASLAGDLAAAGGAGGGFELTLDETLNSGVASGPRPSFAAPWTSLPACMGDGSAAGLVGLGAMPLAVRTGLRGAQQPQAAAVSAAAAC